MDEPLLPVAHITRRPDQWPANISDRNAIEQWPWDELDPLPPFMLADGSGPAQEQTTVRLCYDPERLYLRYDCVDHDIWGVATARDSRIFEEEVIELFIAAGESIPSYYYEFEVSPLGTLLDLEVANPDGNRATLQPNFAWDCPDLAWWVTRNDAANRWKAYLCVPWRALGAGAILPHVWRANFYRIERPRQGQPEFSCWSPTLTNPPDYHRPERFGYLYLA